MAALQINTGPQPQDSAGHWNREKDQYSGHTLSQGLKV